MHLYHNPASSCSQKVRMALHEKGIEYEGTIVDLQKGEQFEADYMKLNPNAVVPTLSDNDAILIESTLINEYLDDAYPDIPLKPDSAVQKHRMRLFNKKIDDVLHPACGVMTYAIGIRPGLLQRPSEEVDAMIAKIPNATRRAARESVGANGVFAPEVKTAMASHADLFDTADELLAGTTWVASDAFSLADCALLPYVLRMDHLDQAEIITSRPNLARWYNAVRARPAYTQAIDNWLPEPLVKMFRQAGEAVADDLKKALSN